MQGLLRSLRRLPKALLNLGSHSSRAPQRSSSSSDPSGDLQPILACFFMRGLRGAFVGSGKGIFCPFEKSNGLNSSGTDGCMTGLFL
mmetsp:Transcript_96630/g.230024  ORF Transcript_96630/g.230024 Transcript_96630/m.230024 type:complete len:87 (-) Transcript_96630:1285-1545(-)